MAPGVPRLVRLACLHRAQNADQTRLVAAFGKDPLDDGLLADGALAHELDIDPVLLRKLFGVAPDPIAQRLGEPRVIEDSDAVGLEVRCAHTTAATFAVRAGDVAATAMCGAPREVGVLVLAAIRDVRVAIRIARFASDESACSGRRASMFPVGTRAS